MIIYFSIPKDMCSIQFIFVCGRLVKLWKSSCDSFDAAASPMGSEYGSVQSQNM